MFEERCEPRERPMHDVTLQIRCGSHGLYERLGVTALSTRLSLWYNTTSLEGRPSSEEGLPILGKVIMEHVTVTQVCSR
jgi:hypothetical protein